ncbi:MAG: serine hydrolase [Anaerolineae bacterium]|nr:serine hydrolase [Anaerolineae bacterium]NIN96736.1 serine hydrolase [Anaerolineae bacterium]NIQ79732.1 serine hydrolase [Anaerolineae bacterium]
MDHTAIGNKLQSEIDALVRKSKDIFSAVLGVATKNGDFYWSGAAGTAHADKGDVMKVDTPIFIASITKMYTAAATLILEERGLLTLDDPISKFLPSSLVEGLHRYKGRDYSELLRVYHLISQTSGLPDYFLAKPKGGKSMFDLIVGGSDEEWDVEKIVDIAKSSLSPKFPPEPKGQETSGKKAHYSDTNYQLLGAIIESVTEKPLHEVFYELIIEPLELSSTYLYGYGRPHAPVGGSPANIYYKERPLYLDKAMRSFGPDGGMVSNVEDSLRFLGNLMDGKLFEAPSTLERMRNWKRISYSLQYGLGLMRFKLPKLLSPFSPKAELIGHAGASNSFLFHSDVGQLYIGGTLNQVQNQGRPFRLMLKVVSIVGGKAS